MGQRTDLASPTLRHARAVLTLAEADGRLRHIPYWREHRARQVDTEQRQQQRDKRETADRDDHGPARACGSRAPALARQRLLLGVEDRKLAANRVDQRLAFECADHLLGLGQSLVTVDQWSEVAALVGCDGAGDFARAQQLRRIFAGKLLQPRELCSESNARLEVGLEEQTLIGQ